MSPWNTALPLSGPKLGTCHCSPPSCSLCSFPWDQRQEAVGFPVGPISVLLSTDPRAQLWCSERVFFQFLPALLTLSLASALKEAARALGKFPSHPPCSLVSRSCVAQRKESTWTVFKLPPLARGFAFSRAKRRGSVKDSFPEALLAFQVLQDSGQRPLSSPGLFIPQLP